LETAESVFAEYARLSHALQSAVKFKMSVLGIPSAETEPETGPKKLRVGINTAMSDGAALAKLLIDKGIITELEYAVAIRDGMRREVEGYKKWFADRGMPVDFG
jgi:hypothetical protein